MKTLVYKRTHNADPEDGRFGSHDCMGKIRALEFDAVIGIGALTKEASSHAIDGRVNWIGIGPKKEPSLNVDYRGPEVTFNHFIQFNPNDAPMFSDIAPSLAVRFYGPNPVRFVLNCVRSDEQAEIDELLKLAHKAPRSKSLRRKYRPCSTKKPVC